MASFGRAVRQAREDREMSQVDLAQLVGLSQSAVSQWERGHNAPVEPAEVFRLEELLGVAPGALSCHLGYVPLGWAGPSADTVAVIRSDPRLDDRQRRALVANYRIFVGD